MAVGSVQPEARSPTVADTGLEAPRSNLRARFLFAMYIGGGGGQISLILPIVRRLAERGHQVRILAGPSVFPDRHPVNDWFIDKIAAAGATYLPFDEPAIHPLDAAANSRQVSLPLIPRPIASAAVRARSYRWSCAWADNITAELARAATDVVVVDHLLPGALAAAEAAGVPAAVLVHGIYKHRPAPGLPPPGSGFTPPNGPLAILRQQLYAIGSQSVFQCVALPPLNRAREHLGLRPLRSAFQQYDSAQRSLILTGRAFDFPARRLPLNVRYIGSPADDADAPQWKLPWPPEDTRPLILVSLSTGNQGQAAVMHRILSALGELAVRGLVTLGPALDPTPFRASPNVVLETFVPHTPVLPYVSAMVTQCGAATVMKALTHGVPLVCIPVLGDQPDNAARVVAHGAGVRLSIRASTEQIRRAIWQVLNEPRFRHSAQRLAATLAREQPANAAVLELEELLRVNSTPIGLSTNAHEEKMP
jgi:MGT family glycosyltransferase